MRMSDDMGGTFRGKFRDASVNGPWSAFIPPKSDALAA